MDIPFNIGDLQKRVSIHEKFRGQRYGGISTPKNQPFIFLFTGSKGEQYGYNDREENGYFLFYGEGQAGNMQYVRGNKAIRDHVSNGKHLLLFKGMPHGECEFLGEMELVSHQAEKSSDENGQIRQAIVFRLKPMGAN